MKQFLGQSESLGRRVFNQDVLEALIAGDAEKCNLVGDIWSNYSDLTRPGPRRASKSEGKSPYFREI